MPGFELIPYDDVGALQQKLEEDPNIVAFMVEPIQVLFCPSFLSFLCGTLCGWLLGWLVEGRCSRGWARVRTLWLPWWSPSRCVLLMGWLLGGWRWKGAAVEAGGGSERHGAFMVRPQHPRAASLGGCVGAGAVGAPARLGAGKGRVRWVLRAHESTAP